MVKRRYWQLAAISAALLSLVLTGCTVPAVINIEVDAVLEHRINDYPIFNATDMDFTDYPTLKKAIDQLVLLLEDPSSTGDEYVFLRIDEDEANRIKSLLGEDGEITHYIAYRQHVFYVHFAVP